MRTALLSLIAVRLLTAQVPASPPPETPALVRFVAPPYPRAAKLLRIAGTASAQITIGPDGSVTGAKTIDSHAVFENYVLDALRQWRFRTSDRAHSLEIAFRFEFDDKCEGTDKHPILSETRVSAELPTVVHIKTGLQCMERTDAQSRR